MSLGVLTSGNLGATVLEQINQHYKIIFVLTDNKSERVINFCNANKIFCFCGNPRNSKAYSVIKNLSVDIIVSVNYLYLVQSDIINHPKKMIFNIHGSLLPKYRGRAPHIWSIINNEKKTGITAHVIDEGCDTGDIISQIEINIDDNDTGNDILEKYNSEYFKIIKKVIKKIKSKNIILKKQNEREATFFGKRTPEQGLINWNWQKERIKNWVRALSYPYPGSFSYINSKKVIIDEVDFVNLGYRYDDQNGKIVSIKPLLVKTPNGIIRIKKIRNNIHNIKINEIFN